MPSLDPNSGCSRGGGLTDECFDVDQDDDDSFAGDPFILPGVDMYDDSCVHKHFATLLLVT